MHREPRPEWVPAVEQSGREERWVMLCLLAGREVEIDPDELNGAVRRAELLLASGGDPRRGPELHGRAATAVAADLDTPDRRAALRAGLRGLASETAEHAVVDEALHVLLDDDELAWLAYATSLLAEALLDGE